MEIAWLTDPAAHDASRVGGKVANLSRLAGAQRVPPGFCLTVEFFDRIGWRWKAGMDEPPLVPPAALEALAHAYDRLAARCGDNQLAVAVRSSSVEEDSQLASFAGAYDTYLNVAGIERLASAVARSWASTQTPRALEYRRSRGLATDNPRFAVLVQQFIPADMSAVVFSSNPISRCEDEVVINANWGLGESIVGGRVTPDTYVVRKSDLSVVSRRVADKRHMVIPAQGGTRDVETPRMFRRRSTLEESQILALARLAVELQTTMGCPVDVECAYWAGDVHVLQCRPITTLRQTAVNIDSGSVGIDTQQMDIDTRQLGIDTAQLGNERLLNPSLTAQTPSMPLPLPPDFPVVWDSPGDAHLFWFINRMHNAEPILPLDELFLRHIYEDGMNFSAQAYDWPIRSAVRRINTYWYWSVTPQALSPKALENRNNSSEQKLNAVLVRLRDVWNSEWLPEIQQCLSEWETFDLRQATTGRFLRHFEATIARDKRVWEIHFLLAWPMLVAMNAFDEFSRDLFGHQRPLDHFHLLEGFDNKSVEVNRALWQLSRKARATAVVRGVLQQYEAAEVVPRLEESPEGQFFMGDVRRFLDEYGRRGARITVSGPSWIEDPTPMVKSLKDFTLQADRDIDDDLEARARDRERLIEEMRDRLSGYPRPLISQFEISLRAAQDATVLQEDHNFWIDQRWVYQVRRVLLEFGRRLADADLIGAREDVFYLTGDELGETAEALPKIVRHGLVTERKAEIERFRAITPPLALGTLPTDPPPDTPIGRAVDKFFGVPIPPGSDPDILRGHSGSSGIARGPARVVRSLADTEKVQRGDVLVAETTMPPWMALFGTVAAVVTDVGGLTSHCAIVAREYRVPAVVGTGLATSVIHDGDLLEVDGSAGLVRIVSRA